MTPRAQIRLLPDGRRLHLNDGPIDIVLEACGPAAEIKTAYRAASQRFVTILDELCSELTFLRQPTQGGRFPSVSREAAQDYSPRRKPWESSSESQSPEGAKEAVSRALAHVDVPRGAVARRMVAAVTPLVLKTFITPMAAVAGAVAEEILEAMTNSSTLTRAYVNDGGDIALHLTPGEQFTIGIVERPDRPSLFGATTIHAHQPIRGIATSGWRGRSFSLGIADAVTVLADTAAMADAAATIIANAVDLPGHPAITRVPASELAPDTDLGNRLVTQQVAELTANEIETALSAGLRVAEALRMQHLIRAAALNLRGHTRVAGPEFGLREGTASAVPLDSIRTGASAPAGALGADEAIHA